MRAPAVNDLLEPVLKLSGSPKEFRTLINWIKAHSDALAGSRLFLAGWSTKPALPSVLIAVELPSTEEAKKFEGELRGFIPKLLAKPSPSPSPSPSDGPALATTSKGMIVENIEVTTTPSYQIKQTGSLVLLSDKVVVLKDLKPRGSKLLTENPLFATARNRFASESVFLYVDLKSIQKEQEEQLRKYEEEDRLRREKEAANPPKVEEAETATMEDPMLMPPEDLEASYEVAPTPDSSPSPGPTLVAPPPEEGVETATPSGSPAAGPGPPDWAMWSIYSAFFGGPRKWPDGVAAAANFEDEGYSLRVLVLDSEDNKSSPIPFVPLLISGPAITPAASGIFPADTNLFVSASLDYHQIYEGMLKTIAFMEEGDPRKSASQPVSSREPPSSPFAEYEKRIGLKVKEDLIPLLGNEVAIAMPKQSMVAPSPSPTPEPGKENPAKQDSANRPRPPEPSFTPVIAIAIKDRDGVKRLIPKVIEGMGLKGASMLAQTEKLEDVELTSYAGVFSYAFMGDFLVVSPDAKLTRYVVDSYLKRQILASDSSFRNSTRWQPRQLQGQVYIAPAVIDLYYPLGKEQPTEENERLRELISGMGPVIDPLTYSLSNDGLGALHELRVPKNLLMFFIAGMTSQASESSVTTNESIARNLLRTIVSAEATFKETKGDGRYGTLDELVSEGLLSKDLIERYGYRLEVSAISNKFEATAVPLEYGKTGRMSFFVDDSGVLRGGDHGGGPATLSDKPVEQ